MEQDLTRFEDKILCDDSTGCNEVDNYFATEADKMIDILYEYDLENIYIFKAVSHIHRNRTEPKN